MSRVRNAPLIAWNLWQVARNRALRWARHYAHRGRTVRRRAGKQAHRAGIGLRNVRVAGSNLIDRLNASLVRLWKRGHRFNDHVVTVYRAEREVKGEIRHAARGSDPILVGPWLSEVGFEVLYWVPFLRWFADTHRLAADRLIAISRGGVSSWYQGIATRYVEIFDHVSPDELSRWSLQRRERGDQKQLAVTEFEQELLARVKERLGLRRARVCHPSLMFRLFRRFWFGDRPLDFLLRHTRYERQSPAASPLRGLPEDYIAVKFYSGPALPDTPANRLAMRALVERAAERTPVVLLDAGLGVDEHRDYPFDGIPRVTSVREILTPRTNLGVQTDVIARARMYLGTCGSVAWLAPMLGVPTVAVYADDRFLSTHLYVARQVFRSIDAGRFATLDLSAAECLGLAASSGEGRAAAGVSAALHPR